jgi:hypothetical protein
MKYTLFFIFTCFFDGIEIAEAYLPKWGSPNHEDLEINTANAFKAAYELQ